MKCASKSHVAVRIGLPLIASLVLTGIAGIFTGAAEGRRDVLLGDFNLDCVLDIDDLDMLCMRIIEGADARIYPEYDLDNNGVIDNRDVEVWLELLGDYVCENDPTNGHLIFHGGDINLDGNVNEFDYLTMLANWGGYGAWSSGDFDCDGCIAMSDLLIILSNWGHGEHRHCDGFHGG